MDFCKTASRSEKFGDTKRVTRSSKPKQDSQHKSQREKGQQDKQRSTKHVHYTENKRSSNMSPTKTRGWTQLIVYITLRYYFELFAKHSLNISFLKPFKFLSFKKKRFELKGHKSNFPFIPVLAIFQLLLDFNVLKTQTRFIYYVSFNLILIRAMCITKWMQ